MDCFEAAISVYSTQCREFVQETCSIPTVYMQCTTVYIQYMCNVHKKYNAHTAYCMYTYSIRTVYIQYTCSIQTCTYSTHAVMHTVIHTVYRQYTYSVHAVHNTTVMHTVSIQYTYSIHTVYRQYAYGMHTVYSKRVVSACSEHRHAVYTTYIQHGIDRFAVQTECTQYAVYIVYTQCIPYMQETLRWVYNSCSVCSVRSVYSTHKVYSIHAYTVFLRSKAVSKLFFSAAGPCLTPF